MAAFPTNPSSGNKHNQGDREYVYSNGVWYHQRDANFRKEIEYKSVGGAQGWVNVSISLPQNFFFNSPALVNYTVEWGSNSTNGLDLGGRYVDCYIRGFNNGVGQGNSARNTFLVGDTGRLYGSNMAAGYAQILEPSNSRVDEFRSKLIYNYDQDQPGPWINFFLTVSVQYGKI